LLADVKAVADAGIAARLEKALVDAGVAAFKKALEDADAKADLESKVNAAVQRQSEANANRSKRDHLSRGRFWKMSIKDFLEYEGLKDDGWFEEMEKFTEVLPQQQSDYEKANKVWTQFHAEHTLAQSEVAEAQPISDKARYGSCTSASALL
jgi:hypothetical protein